MYTGRCFSSNGFRFDARKGLWSLDGAPGRGAGAALRDAGFRVTVNGRKFTLAGAEKIELLPLPCPGRGRPAGGKGTGLEIRASFSRPSWAWRIVFEIPAGGGRVVIDSEITNTGEEKITLDDCCPWVLGEDSPGSLELGGKPEKARVFCFTGTLHTQLVKELGTGQEAHRSSYFQHIHDPETSRTLLAGFLTFDRMDTLFECRYEKSGKNLDCSGACQFRGHALAPGEKAAGETLSVGFHDDPRTALEEWAGAVARRYRPPIRREAPPVGWLGWSWIDFSVETPESQLRRNLRAIRERLSGYGLEYIWVSIANLRDGLPGNWLETNERFFPAGFRKAVDEIRRAGLKPGLWTGLFMLNRDSVAFGENRANLFRDPVTGKPQARGRWLWANAAKDGREPVNHGLDCSHPASIAFLERVYAAYREWGIRYYMLDFLGYGDPGEAGYHDRSLIRGPAIRRRGLAAARAAAREDTHLLTAAGSTVDNVGLVDTMRIGVDYGEGRQLQPRFPSYPATYVVNGSFGSCGSPQENCLQNTAAYFFTHRKLFLNGQNMLTVDRPIPRNEAEFSATLFGMTGSPVMLGDDLEMISEDRLGMIRKILPRPEDWPFPADLFRRIHPDDYCRVLVAPVRAGWGQWTVVAVFNLDERASLTEISAAELRLPDSADFLAWDFWAERYCGRVRGRFVVETPPNSCRVLRLSRPLARPAVLSTDLHLRQGQLELDGVRWDGRAGVLNGVATRPRGERGNLYIAAPWGWKPADPAGLFVATDARDGLLIVRKPLHFERERLEWRIPFEPLTASEKNWKRKHGRNIRPEPRPVI